MTNKVTMPEPDYYTYIVNGTTRHISDSLPPDDAYDEGTLTRLYTARQRRGEPVAWPTKADEGMLRAMVAWRESDGREGLSGETAMMDRIYHALYSHMRENGYVPQPAAPETPDSASEVALTLLGLIIKGRVASRPEQGAQSWHMRDLIGQMIPHLEKLHGIEGSAPAQEPSDSEIMWEWANTPNTGDMRVDLVVFARALLARYGSKS